MKHIRTFLVPVIGFLFCTHTIQVQAAIALDRTRVIVEGGKKSISLAVSNENKQLPYLAQGWIENALGQKISTPLTVLPPVQRIEPGERSQVRIQTLPAINTLPQDRETLYYFNLREIPPRTDKPNALQLALQTRIKLFYRPKALITDITAPPWQEQLTLTRSGKNWQINNPTPYYITLVDGSDHPGRSSVLGFKPLMLSPFSTGEIPGKGLGNSPVLTYINDYGGRPQIRFICSGTRCTAKSVTTR